MNYDNICNLVEMAFKEGYMTGRKGGLDVSNPVNYAKPDEAWDHSEAKSELLELEDC